MYSIHAFLISCKIRAKIEGQKSRILALLFAGLMNYSYLCIVNRNDGIWAQGTKKLLSGLAKFTACPERKKEVANGDKAKPKQKLKTKTKLLTNKTKLRGD